MTDTTARLNARVKALIETKTFQQAWRFGLCGAGATALQYSVLALLVDGLRAPDWLAGLFVGACGAGGCGGDPLTMGASACAVFAYLCGSFTTYVLNRRFTFEVKPPFWRGFLKMLPFNLVGLGINTAIFATLFQLGLHYLLAQAIATGLVTIYNYAVARFIVFRS